MFLNLYGGRTQLCLTNPRFPSPYKTHTTLLSELNLSLNPLSTLLTILFIIILPSSVK